ncbi:hypothetical protein ABFT80_14030 [Mesorhizobium sp. SB112]|uniref:hypothetical protein n=1 Tax=Mesorhizobium sp. SB112 TaxID=3151853 RepID=UPI003265F129
MLLVITTRPCITYFKQQSSNREATSMAENPLVSVLTGPDAPTPLYLRRFEIEVDYLPAFDVEERREVLDDAVGELQDGLRLGFFAWSFFEKRTSTSLSIDWSKPGRFVLRGKAEGIHHNVLVAVLRLIVTLNHTMLAAYEDTKAMLGDDADALPPRSVFSDTIAAVRVSVLQGADDRISARRDFTDFLTDAEIQVPNSDLLEDVMALCEEDHLVVSGQDFPPADFDEAENVFLRICDSGCFRGLDLIDKPGYDGDAEIFSRPDRDTGAELIVDGYTPQYYGLVELLNSLSSGRVGTLSLSSED